MFDGMNLLMALLALAVLAVLVGVWVVSMVRER